MAENLQSHEPAPYPEARSTADHEAGTRPDRHPHHTESLESYLHTISSRPLLSAAEERQLARRAQSGCPRAKDELVRRNLRLVVHNARRYRNMGLEFEELIQEGTLSLIRAAEKFDPSRGNKFSTYATWWIRQKVGRAVMDKSRSVRIPVHYQESLRKLGQAENRLSATLGREPRSEELAQHLGVSTRRVAGMLKARRPVASLDAPIVTDLGSDGDTTGLISIVADEEQTGEAALMAQHADDRTRLARCLPHLSERQRFVIEKRYGLDGGPVWTLEELGKELSTHTEAIRKHQKRAEAALRMMLADNSPGNLGEHGPDSRR